MNKINNKLKLGIRLLIITLVLLIIGAIPILILSNEEFIKNYSAIFLIGYLMLYYIALAIGLIMGVISLILIGIGLYKKNVLHFIIFILILLILLGIIFFIFQDSIFFSIMGDFTKNFIGSFTHSDVESITNDKLNYYNIAK